TGYLLLLSLGLAVPFFFAANCIGLSFYRFGKISGRIYSADLTGAGVGAIGVIVFLFLVPPLSALVYLSALGMLAGVINCRRSPWFVSLMLTCIILLVLFLPSRLHLQLSPYKSLSQILQIQGAEQRQERSSPLGLLTVVASPQVPFRYAPGLSLNASHEPPPQLGIFNDGEGPIILTRYQGNPESLGYLDYLTSALPYHLREQPKTLILGAGGGHDVLQAVYHQARAVDAVESNPQVVQLVNEDYVDFTGHIYQRPEVRLHTAGGRNFIQGTRETYDVIQLALVDDFAVANAGLSALSEHYLHTQEALSQLLSRLKPDGLLSFTRWLKLPPRDALKLFATAVAVLEEQGRAPA
ncbi:MAG: SAM-dependent methyltransferase, partial [Candidatus Electrothrix sp. ATG2]|nr:SAM-dependent methyltransferase [Candidatus Electrothrix sp. ATG2]